MPAPQVLAALSGLGLGLSLIIAIGAQNAFVLRQGLLGQHVLPQQALPEHEGVLGADRDDQAQPEPQARQGGEDLRCRHTPTLRP